MGPFPSYRWCRTFLAIVSFSLAISFAHPLTAQTGEDDGRVPVPGASARQKAQARIEELFSISKAKTAAAKRELALQLIETGRETAEDPDAQFVLFNLARELAGAAGDLETALTAVEEMDAVFRIDADVVRLSTFDLAAKASLSNASRETVATAGIDIVDDLLSRDKYLEAARLIQTLQTITRPLRNRELVDGLTERRNRGSTLYKQYQKAATALATLEEKPGDPSANLAAGQFYAFAKNDWQRGLPLLAKGNNDKLKALAEQELAMTSTADEQIKLADAWWTFAQGSTGVESDRQLARSRMWYERAAGKLSGLSKVQAQKRIESLAKVTLDGGEPFSDRVARADRPVSPFDGGDEPHVEPAEPIDDAGEAAAEPLVARADLPTGALLRIGSRRLMHTGGIDKLTLATDGVHVVTVGSHRVHRWNLKDGTSGYTESFPVGFHRGNFYFDGERFLLVAEPVVDGINTQNFRLVDLSTGKTTSKFTHNMHTDSAALSPGGQLAAISNHDRSVAIVDPRTGEVIDTVPNVDGNGDRALAEFSKSGSVLAIRHGATVKFYNVVMRSQLGKEIGSARQDGMWTLALSDNGDVAALVKNGSSAIVNTRSGDIVRDVAHPAQYHVFGSALSADGKFLALYIYDFNIYVMDVAGGGLVKKIPTGTGLIRQLTFTPDGRRLIGSHGGRVLVWDIATGKEISVDPQFDMISPPQSVAFSPDGRSVASADEKGYVTMWSQAAKWRGEQMPTEGSGRFDPRVLGDFLQFAADGKRLIAGSNNLRNSVNIWEVASRRLVGTLDGHAWPVMTVAFCEATGMIASTGRDSTLRFWNDRGQQLRSVPNTAGCLDFSPNGKLIAVVSSPETHGQRPVNLFDTSNGDLVKQLEGHTEATLDVSFSPDGKRLVSTAGDKTLRIWDVTTGETIRSIALPSETTRFTPGARAVAYSPRGDMIASTGSDGGIYLWTPDGEAIATLHGHEGAALCLAWRKDGKQLISGGSDASIVIWDIAKATAR